MNWKAFAAEIIAAIANIDTIQIYSNWDKNLTMTAVKSTHEMLDSVANLKQLLVNHSSSVHAISAISKFGSFSRKKVFYQYNVQRNVTNFFN